MLSIRKSNQMNPVGNAPYLKAELFGGSAFKLVTVGKLASDADRTTSRDGRLDSKWRADCRAAIVIDDYRIARRW